MSPYKLFNSFDGVYRVEDGVWIPPNTANRDWQDYQAWLEADPANQPDPAE